MRRVFALAALAAVALLAGCAGSGPSEIQVAVTENGFEPGRRSS